jgi:ABC-2 type transport system permease protein
VSVDVRHPALVFWFGLMGALLLSFLGLLTSVWAEKFDHAAAVTNFVVTPLSLLSGTFYSVRQLAPAFQAVSHANPFFYVISGFRAGFLGISDSPLMVGAIGLLVLNLLLWAACYALLRSGWKIKN